MKLVTSWDDGCASDKDMFFLLKKYDVEGVFYWPVEWRSVAYENGYEPLSFYDAEDIAEEFEIGSHSVTHRLLTRIPENEAYYEIYASQDQLKYMFGLEEVTKFCPPRGYMNQDLTELALEHYEEIRLTKGGNLVHVHPKSGVNDDKPWQEVAIEKAKEFDVIELWGHTWELDKYDLWEELESFFKEHNDEDIRS